MLFTIAFTANMRGHIPALPKSAEWVWINNGNIPFCVPAIPIADLCNMSVGEIALRIRETVVAQRTVEQMEKTMTVYREMARQECYPAYHAASGTNYYVTSWASAKWTELDFSPALVSDSEKG